MTLRDHLRFLREAAQDSMQDDFPTIRHEGAARMAHLLDEATRQTLRVPADVNATVLIASIDRFVGEALYNGVDL